MAEGPAAKKKRLEDPEQRRFGGRVAIVTGGASGIGLATVERLAREGATVSFFDINKSAGEQVVKDLASKGLEVSYFEVDVTDKEKCVATVKEIAEANDGNVHLLVNGAAYFGCKGITVEKKDWEKTFSVNVIGYSNMVQAVYPFMKEMKGVDKSIVNIASTAAHRVQPNRWTYCASKGAVVIMTKCMALDLSTDGIRVNSVSPAWVWTPEVIKAAVGGREKWEPIWGSFHMPRRFCEASEVASAICFLLSQDASYITSTDLPVDGGYTSMTAEGFGEKTTFAGTDY